jgi:esterase/lipase
VPDDTYRFLRSNDLFADEIHKPFHLDGDGTRAAVLIHGFPATPAEMRPLGDVLHAAGWTVTAPLLPGFGPNIATLPGRKHGEWRDAIQAVVADARRTHERVVLVGHSLGASVSLLAAAREPVDAHVLLAPYWRFGGSIRNFLWPVLRIWAGRWTPLANANFDDERVRSGILRLLPDLDLDSMVVRDDLKRFKVPTRLLDELRTVGATARMVAGRSQTKTLIVQGLRDELVQPRDTDTLLNAIAGARLELIDATHDLTSPDDGAWARVTRAVLAFLDEQPTS